jgi:hypothetical protein
MNIHTQEDITVAAEIDLPAQTLRATISGNASINSRVALDRFLVSVHQDACQRALRRVVMDFRQLAFLNSSCLKSLVTWILAIKDLPPERRYQVTFLSSLELNWQQRSLFAISSLALELVTIE